MNNFEQIMQKIKTIPKYAIPELVLTGNTSVELLKQLDEAKIFDNYKNSSCDWWAIIMDFYKAKNYEPIFYLLDKINIINYGYILLSCSCGREDDDYDIIDKITKSPKILDLFNTATVGNRCLTNAFKAGKSNILKLLLERGAKVDSQIFLYLQDLISEQKDEMIGIIRNYFDTIGEIHINIANGFYGEILKFRGYDMTDKSYFSDKVQNIFSNEDIEIFKKYNYRFDNHRNLSIDLDNYAQICDTLRDISAPCPCCQKSS